MANTNVENIRNLVLCGHGSSGKTTLLDTLLVKTGAVNANPKVDDGTSICDFDEEEKHHKHTIESTLIHFKHAGKLFNAIDTPGYPDYIGQVIGALRGVDLAVVAVNAHSGVEVNTRHVYDEAEKAGLGRVILVTKMDTDNLEIPELVASIQSLWGPKCVPLNVPVGHGADFKGVLSTLKVPDDASGALIDPSEIQESLIESIIEVDEAVMERYLEGTQPTDEELSRLLVRAIAEGSLVPILFCSAQTGVGLDELLDTLAKYGPSPNDVKRTALKDEEEVEITADPAGPLVAQVFKTRIDPFVQKLSYLRVFSGTLKKDSTIEASCSRKGLKITQLFSVQANETHPVDEAVAGEIVAVAKVEDMHTGTTAGDLKMRPIEFPTPMVGLAVLPKTHGDEAKLSGALHKVLEEDSTFQLNRNNQTKELVITGMSELHLQIIQERIARRDKVELDVHEPKIAYRETIQADAEGSYRHKKQSGGRGQFGEVHIRMKPLPRGTDIEDFCSKSRFPSLKTYHYDEDHNFLWVDSVVGGTIPGNFMPAIEKGFKERLARGVIAGHQIQDLCIEVHFGKHHPVDSSEAAFKTAGSMAFRNVFQEARPSLLEPVVSLDITVPEESVGDVYSDMSGRRGRVQGADAAGGDMQTVHAEAPLAEVTTYARTLSSMTGGHGSYAMKFSHYEVVPPNVQQEIISKAKLEEEEDD